MGDVIKIPAAGGCNPKGRNTTLVRERSNQETTYGRVQGKGREAFKRNAERPQKGKIARSGCLCRSLSPSVSLSYPPDCVSVYPAFLSGLSVSSLVFRVCLSVWSVRSFILSFVCQALCLPVLPVGFVHVPVTLDMFLGNLSALHTCTSVPLSNARYIYKCLVWRLSVGHNFLVRLSVYPSDYSYLSVCMHTRLSAHPSGLGFLTTCLARVSLRLTA